MNERSLHSMEELDKDNFRVIMTILKNNIITLLFKGYMLIFIIERVKLHEFVHHRNGADKGEKFMEHSKLLNMLFT